MSTKLLVLTPPASLALSSACTFSSLVENTESSLGSILNPSYQPDLRHWEPGAFMWRTSSASSVTSKFGPMRHGDPSKQCQRCSDELARTALDTIFLESFELCFVGASVDLLPKEPETRDRRQRRAFELSELTIIDEAPHDNISQEANRDCESNE